MRPITLDRNNYLIIGSASGGRAATIAYTLIGTSKLNDVDPQAWLFEVLERLPDYKINPSTNCSPGTARQSQIQRPAPDHTKGGYAGRLQRCVRYARISV